MYVLCLARTQTHTKQAKHNALHTTCIFLFLVVSEPKQTLNTMYIPRS